MVATADLKTPPPPLPIFVLVTHKPVRASAASPSTWLSAARAEYGTFVAKRCGCVRCTLEVVSLLVAYGGCGFLLFVDCVCECCDPRPELVRLPSSGIVLSKLKIGFGPPRPGLVVCVQHQLLCRISHETLAKQRSPLP